MVKKEKTFRDIALGQVKASVLIGSGTGILQKAGYSTVGVTRLSRYVPAVRALEMGKFMLGKIKKFKVKKIKKIRKR